MLTFSSDARAGMNALPDDGSWAVLATSVLPRAPEACSTAASRAALAEPVAAQRRNCRELRNTACNQLHSRQRTDAPSLHHVALFLRKAFWCCAPDTHSFLLDGIS